MRDYTRKKDKDSTRRKYMDKKARFNCSKIIGSILNGEFSSNKNGDMKKGPRAIFLERLSVTGNFDEAKKALSDKGYNSEIYGDKTLKQWIKEGR